MDRRDFILTAKAMGSALTIPQLIAGYQNVADNIPPDAVATDTAGIIESNKVNTWLVLLRNGTAAQLIQFESLRKRTFVEQREAWTTAGKP